MQAVHGLRMPLPNYFSLVLESVLNTDIKKCLQSEKIDFLQLNSLVDDVNKWRLHLDKDVLGFTVSTRINFYLKEWSSNPYEYAMLLNAVGLLSVAERLSLDLNIWKAQNMYFSEGKKILPAMKDKADLNDAQAKEWLKHFMRLGDYLKVKIE